MAPCSNRRRKTPSASSACELPRGGSSGDDVRAGGDDERADELVLHETGPVSRRSEHPMRLPDLLSHGCAQNIDAFYSMHHS